METLIVGLFIVLIIILISNNSKLFSLERVLKELQDSQSRANKKLDFISTEVIGLTKNLESNKDTNRPEENIKSKNKLKDFWGGSIEIEPKALMSESTDSLPIETEIKIEKPTVTEERVSEGKPQINKQESPNPSPSPSPSPSPNPDFLQKFANWFREDWLMKVGSIMLLLALGWFVTYAFINNWVGPLGRVIAGILTAVGLIALGSRRNKDYPNQAGIFMSLGTATMLISMIASSNFYKLLPPFLGLFVSTLTLGYLATKAIKAKSIALVYLSIGLAYICPFLFGYWGNSEFIMGYLLMLIIVIAYINWNWQRQELPLVSSIITFLYSIPCITANLNNPLTNDPNNYITITLAFLSLGVVMSQNLLALANSDEKTTILTGISSMLTTVTLIAWSLRLGSGTTPGYIIAGWALTLYTVSYLLYHKTTNLKAFYTTWAIGAILSLLAANILLDAPEFTIAALTLCCINIYIGYRVNPTGALATNLSYSLLLPSLCALPSLIAPSWQLSPFNTDSLALMLTSITLISTGLWIKKISISTCTEQNKTQSKLLIITGSIYGLALIWLMLIHSPSLEKNIAVAISLSIYTVIGLICYFQGLFKGYPIVKKYGFILVTLVIIRLFLIDLWEMEMSGRIITFFAVGTLLVSTAFIKKKNEKK